ncbi:unnamed protein product [Vicia faba]|uniref:Reverse transcriptase zinc-binding domain-containing protein n=1 Tax=Vicia faba TaxID=3906 RepID=A0AAV0YHC0_VICFA|nr:unnamed protein product [Vicia faba]
MAFGELTGFLNKGFGSGFESGLWPLLERKGIWRPGIIKYQFNNNDVEDILKLPLHNLEEEDTSCWKAAKDDNYSVKTGYHNIIKWEAKPNIVRRSNNNDRTMWEKIWRSKVTPRQQILVWKVVQNIIPSKDNLIKRGISCDPFCPRCPTVMEDTNHCFKNSDWVKHIWYGSPLNLKFSNTNEEYSEWITGNLGNFSPNNLATLIKIVGGIWISINKLIFEGQNIPVIETIKQALNTPINSIKPPPKTSRK